MLLLTLNNFSYAVSNTAGIVAVVCFGGVLFWMLTKMDGFNGLRVYTVLVPVVLRFSLYLMDPNSPERCEVQNQKQISAKLESSARKLSESLHKKGYGYYFVAQLNMMMSKAVQSEFGFPFAHSFADKTDIGIYDYYAFQKPLEKTFESQQKMEAPKTETRSANETQANTDFSWTDFLPGVITTVALWLFLP